MNQRGGSPEPEPAGHDVQVRLARGDDAPALARFNQLMADETEARALPADVVRHGVRAVLDEPEHGFYLVAECDGRVVGSLLVTFEWSDWRNARFWWIQSVYVIPGFRRRGVYRALHAFTEARAREARGVCGLRLYVERDNHAAQQVYRTMGMSETAYRLFEQELATS